MFEVQYKPRGGKFSDACWYVTVEQDGKPVTTRYKRFAAGVALPKQDQPQGAAVVLAERYEAKREIPPAWTAFAAKVGLWPELERTLGELRRMFWVETFVTEPDEAAVEDLRRVPGLYAPGPTSSAVLPAPAHTVGETSGEITRQRVGQLIDQGRLILGPVQAVLDQAGEPAYRALVSLVIWLLEHPVSYTPGLRIKGPSYGWSHPGGGPSGPFDREG